MDVSDLFNNKDAIAEIQKRLPELFYIAELESSRAGRIGMEVGTIRERILIALLIYKFGADNIDGNLPIHEREVDVIAMGKPVSIKTGTTKGKTFSTVKAIWTVDAEQAFQFAQTYVPKCDMLFVQIAWNEVGGFYLFSQAAQLEILEKMGREQYIKLPKPGTNPRGVEISSPAIKRLATHPTTCVFPIKWIRTKVEYDPYERWLDLWKQE